MNTLQRTSFQGKQGDLASYNVAMNKRQRFDYEIPLLLELLFIFSQAMAIVNNLDIGS